MIFTPLIAALALGSTAFAHMEMSFPAPFRGKTNPHASEGSKDFSMTAPLSSGQALCKGYQTDAADQTGVGAPTATFAQGGDANLTIVGGASHGGGSCQAALSYDQGKTFKVIHSWIGSCPLNSGDKFDFKIPSDAATGYAVLAWTWFNKIGNREMYMSCAGITITGGGKRDAASTAFSARPGLFLANIALANGCGTVEGKEVKFPDPGSDVTSKETGDNSGSTTGSCGAAGAQPAAGNSPSAPSPSPVASNPPTAPSPASPAGAFSTSVVPSSPAATASAPAGGAASAAPNSAAPAGALKASTNGECGGVSTCKGSTFGQCCSTYGYCGSTDLHCGTGCMAAFGTCGKASKRIRGGNYAN